MLSGLALAGANPKESGAHDGILTALEVTSLDLYGTELVVLSACETGLGEVIHGEGVQGLQRAFLLAGAEAQIISLWKVHDRATRELMVSYYTHLQRGEGRTEALRQAQLEMLGGEARARPYFWAGFIASGNPAALGGGLHAPDFLRVRPGMRGCGCDVAQEAGARTGAWAAVIVLLAWARRRRSAARTPAPLAGHAHVLRPADVRSGPSSRLARGERWHPECSDVGASCWSTRPDRFLEHAPPRASRPRS